MDSYILFFDDMNMLTTKKWIKQIHNILNPKFVMLWMLYQSKTEYVINLDCIITNKCGILV